MLIMKWTLCVCSQVQNTEPTQPAKMLKVFFVALLVMAAMCLLANMVEARELFSLIDKKQQQQLLLK